MVTKSYIVAMDSKFGVNEFIRTPIQTMTTESYFSSVSSWSVQAWRKQWNDDLKSIK